MIIITLSELISLGLFTFFIITMITLMLIVYLENIYKRKSKKWKNCKDCKFYYLRNVAGWGERCWYGCKLKADIEDETTATARFIYRKCKDYEEK